MKRMRECCQIDQRSKWNGFDLSCTLKWSPLTSIKWNFQKVKRSLLHASEKGDFKPDRKIGQSSAGKCGPTKAHWPAPKWSTWDFPIWQKFRKYRKKGKKLVSWCSMAILRIVFFLDIQTMVRNQFITGFCNLELRTDKLWQMSSSLDVNSHWV